MTEAEREEIKQQRRYVRGVLEKELLHPSSHIRNMLFSLRYRIHKGKFFMDDIHVFKKGQGFFRKVMLPEFEFTLACHSFTELHVCEVLTTRFMEFFEKRGWYLYDTDCYMRTLSVHYLKPEDWKDL